jgi:hypothetical protein
MKSQERSKLAIAIRVEAYIPDIRYLAIEKSPYQCEREQGSRWLPKRVLVPCD